MNRAIIFLAASAVTSVAVTAACFAASPFPISFKIERGTTPDRVQLRLDTRFDGRGKNDWSQGFNPADLKGLNLARLNAPASAPTRFAIVREAGRIDCSGTGRSGIANGGCGFTPNPMFSAMLAKRGMARPDIKESFALTMSGAGKPLLDALDGAGYRRVTLDQLVALSIHRVTPAYIGALTRSGIRTDDADDLVAMRIFNVTPDYINSFAAVGYRNIPADKLVELRIFGVTPADVRAISGNRAVRPSVEQLVRARLTGAIAGRQSAK